MSDEFAQHNPNGGGGSTFPPYITPGQPNVPVTQPNAPYPVTVPNPVPGYQPQRVYPGATPNVYPVPYVPYVSPAATRVTVENTVTIPLDYFRELVRKAVLFDQSQEKVQSAHPLDPDSPSF